MKPAEQSPDAIAAITDPGEVGRAEHNKGDRFVITVGNVFAWLFPILMIAICAQVVLRGMGHNQAWLDDLQWWLYGAAAMIGIAYAVTTNSHVRVDIFYDNFPRRKQTVYDIIGLVWLFLPFIMISWDVTLGYGLSSFFTDEGSSSPNGLHNLWILKLFVNAAFVLVAIAVWSAYVRALSRLTRPALWKQMLFAFPSTVFAVNLAIYYALVGWVMMTDPEADNMRKALRAPVFDDFKVGPYDLLYTVVAAFVIAVLLIVLARVFARKEG